MTDPGDRILKDIRVLSKVHRLTVSADAEPACHDDYGSGVVKRRDRAADIGILERESLSGPRQSPVKTNLCLVDQLGTEQVGVREREVAEVLRVRGGRTGQ